MVRILTLLFSLPGIAFFIIYGLMRFDLMPKQFMNFKYFGVFMMLAYAAIASFILLIVLLIIYYIVKKIR